MRYSALSITLLVGLISCSSPEAPSSLEGEQLYRTVENYVSIGEHRSATPADYATANWLKDELTENGYTVKFTEFRTNQFFPETVFVQDENTSERYEAFPLWYLRDSINLENVGAQLVKDTADLKAVRDKIVLLNFSFGDHGQSASGIRKHLQNLITAGARAIVGYSENKAGEIVAFNAPIKAAPWSVPIVIVSPGDAAKLSEKAGQPVRVSVKGKFEDVTVKNVYGTIGNGDQYIVVSTPISGWFTCGGERGPGVAIWLGLAKWVSTQDLPYTFVFTGNSGHELGFRGAHEFLEHDAPPVEKTKLWIHLGAGAATLSWKETSSGLVKEHAVDSARNFFYTTSVKKEFDHAFQGIAGNKWDTEKRVGGELVNVLEKGYKNGIGISYSHPYFHTPHDDAATTSPEILEETALAFKHFIEEVAGN